MTTMALQSGFTFTVSDVFQNPVLAHLAAHNSPNLTIFEKDDGLPLVSDVQFNGIVNTCALDLNGIDAIYPVLPLQAGMIIETMRDSSKYVMHQAWNVDCERVSLSAIKSAWYQLVDSHSVLRTRFVYTPEGVFQVVLKAGCDASFKIVKVANDFDGDWESFLQSDLKESFNIESECPRRLTLYTSDDGSQLRMVLTIHHAIYDGQSLGIMLRDLIGAVFGTSIISGTQYRSVLKYVTSRSANEMEVYWKSQLAGIQPAQTLKLRGESSHSESRNTTTRIWTKRETKKVFEICKTKKITVANFMRTVWALTLSYYTRDTDVVFGDVHSGRDLPIENIGSVVGLLINTVPLRISLSGGADFFEIARIIQVTYGESLPHSYVSLADIQQWCGLSGENQMFNSIFAYQSFENVPDNAENSAFTPIKSGGSVADGLVVEVEASESLLWRISYDDMVMTEWHVDCMLAKTYDIINRVLDRGNIEKVLVQELRDLTEADQSRIFEFSSPKYDVSCKYELFQSAFEHHAQVAPEIIAIESERVSFSYSELDMRANALANELRSRGVTRGMNIGILTVRCGETSIAILGVLKTGATYVPLDAGFPSDRLMTICEEAGVSHVVYTPLAASCVDSLLISQENCIPVNPSANLNKLNVSKPEVNISGDDIAFIVFTSGSTGKPKGVPVHHYGITRLMADPIIAKNILSGDRVSQVMAIGFDFSQYELFVSLSVGATACFKESNPYSVFTEVDVVHITPTALSSYDLESLANVRVIFCAGEPLPDALAKKWSSSKIFINAYGPTETSVYSSAALIEPNSSEIVSIGKPLFDTDTYILDSNLQMVPVGVVGEMFIGGACVTSGYINNPQQTIERFIPNSVRKSGKLMYRTGDMARWLPSGNIQILGRIDDQVKLRGYRIELDEITSVICKHSAVQFACAVVKNNILVAYVSPKDVTISSLREHVGKHLPHYMVPSIFQLADRLPMNTNGKVDRLKLKNLALEDLVEASVVLSEEEQKLATIWSQILGTDVPISKNTTFFSLGGNSLSAIKMVSAACMSGFKFTVADVFQRPVLEDLATFWSDSLEISQSLGEEILITNDILEKIYQCLEIELDETNQVESVYPTLPLQMGMLVETLKNSSQYVITQSWDLCGDIVNLANIQIAWKSLIQCHDVLRIRFAFTESGIYQVVLKEAINFEVEYLSWTADEMALKYETFVSDKMATGFDLAKEPLRRLSVISVEGTDKLRVVLTIHHAIYDGQSLGILVSDFFNSICGHRIQQSLKFQVVVSHLLKRSQKESKDYWENAMQGIEPVSPLKLSGSSEIKSGAATKFICWSGSAADKIAFIARKLNVTLASVLRSVWAVLMSYYSRSSDVIFGEVLSGRNLALNGVERAVGLLINTVPIRVQLEDCTFAELVWNLHKFYARSIEFSHASLVDIKQWANIPSSQSMYQSMFVLQEFEVSINDSLPFLVEEKSTPSALESTDLIGQFGIGSSDASVSCSISYNS
ncbi:hypothetical protein HK100_006071, partial [Physocladia obscura]